MLPLAWPTSLIYYALCVSDKDDSDGSDAEKTAPAATSPYTALPDDIGGLNIIYFDALVIERLSRESCMDTRGNAYLTFWRVPIREGTSGICEYQMITSGATKMP